MWWLLLSHDCLIGGGVHPSQATQSCYLMKSLNKIQSVTAHVSLKQTEIRTSTPQRKQTNFRGRLRLVESQFSEVVTKSRQSAKIIS